MSITKRQELASHANLLPLWEMKRTTFKKWKIFNRTLCLSVEYAMELAVEKHYSRALCLLSRRGRAVFRADISRG